MSALASLYPACCAVADCDPARFFSHCHDRFIVSSSNYPRFSVNLQNGKTLLEGGENVTAANTIYLCEEYPSHVMLPVVTMDQLPRYEPIALEEEIVSVVKELWMDLEVDIEQMLSWFEDAMNPLKLLGHW